MTGQTDLERIKAEYDLADDELFPAETLTPLEWEADLEAEGARDGVPAG